MEQLKNALQSKGIPFEPYELYGVTGIKFWVSGRKYFYLEGGSQFKLRSLLETIATAPQNDWPCPQYTNLPTSTQQGHL